MVRARKEGFVQHQRDGFGTMNGPSTTSELIERSGRFLCLVVALAASGCATLRRDHAPAGDIHHLLSEQATAWNEGDIEAFMSAYWNSPDLMFVSGGSVTRGWQPTLERYRKRYPTRNAMGRLTFSELEIREVGPANALVTGRFDLNRVGPEKPVGGRFTLLLRHEDGHWVIVYDHTSGD